MRVASLPPGAGEVSVANQCARCGKMLPNGNTRFCTDCGNIVTSSRPVKRSFSQGPPAWMKQLETSFTNDRPHNPLRELHVKVWKQNENEDNHSQESGNDSVENVADFVDGLPTRPLAVAIAPKMSAPSDSKSIDLEEEEVSDEFPTNPLFESLPENKTFHRVSSSSDSGLANGALKQDDIQDISTLLHVAQPFNIPPALEKPIHPTQVPINSLYNSEVQNPVTPFPFPQTQFPPVQPVRQTPLAAIPVPPLIISKSNNSKRLAIMCSFLFILLLGGVIAWVYFVRPFAVPEITKTTVTYQNTSLGISLQYPQKWTNEVNQQRATIIFYDDNHTDQVKITTVATGNLNLNLFMSKTVSSLAMTGQKTLPALSFAGASWQHVQGSILQSGANYTATLLGIMHGGYFYTIVQIAPSSTYSLEDQLVFSLMRASFQFL